jgi:hypothetical protein
MVAEATSETVTLTPRPLRFLSSTSIVEYSPCRFRRRQRTAKVKRKFPFAKMILAKGLARAPRLHLGGGCDFRTAAQL